jgi:hypothetical protein
MVKRPNKKENNFSEKVTDYFNSGMGDSFEKLNNFAKYVPRQTLTKFFAKYEIFKKIIDVEGSIIECGVRNGGGLLAFSQMSAIFEPINYTRKIVGFDTFSGFPSLSNKDRGSTSLHAHKGGFSTNSFDDIKKSIELYDENRVINEIPKVQLIKGDAVKTIPKYLKDNPHTVVSLLYLDFDIYKPTKIALDNFVPRMPKGSIIAFDELNSEDWKGETIALLDSLKVNDLRIKRFNFDTYFSYAVLE